MNVTAWLEFKLTPVSQPSMLTITSSWIPTKHSQKNLVENNKRELLWKKSGTNTPQNRCTTTYSIHNIHLCKTYTHTHTQTHTRIYIYIYIYSVPQKWIHPSHFCRYLSITVHGTTLTKWSFDTLKSTLCSLYNRVNLFSPHNNSKHSH